MCLKSLQKQKSKYSFEVIIVDGNSKDKTRIIAQKFKAIVIKQKQPGKSWAFQEGADKAAGKILAFTEADCVAPINWLEIIGSYFQNHPETSALSSAYTFSAAGWWQNILVRIFLPLANFFFLLYFGHHSLRASNFAIRKNIFDKAGGFDTNTYEFYDVELSMRVKNLGKIAYLPRMNVKTSNRRIKGRLGKFLREFIPAFFQIAIRKKPVEKMVYEEIR